MKISFSGVHQEAHLQARLRQDQQAKDPSFKQQVGGRQSWQARDRFSGGLDQRNLLSGCSLQGSKQFLVAIQVESTKRRVLQEETSLPEKRRLGKQRAFHQRLNQEDDLIIAYLNNKKMRFAGH